MGERTRKNLFEAFVGEAKAHIRLQAFAERAERDGYPQVAKLFRAISEAERVHALNHLRLLGEAAIKGTEENLAYSFDRERTVNSVYYPEFIRVAEEEGERAAALSFTHAMDVEAGHAKLYEKAMRKLLRDELGDYYVCQVCGYVSDGLLPEVCPICGAKREMFKKVG
ncbi:MAG: rubrerythrin family protein [Candidatus Bipolaricaulia bacterium]